jgi:hypothetical protein
VRPDPLIGRHAYLDITGEIDVFEALAARDAEAKARGIMLLPGVGFDVVPSDCLAAHLKRRLPDANDLRLNLSLGANMSRGTAKTMIEAIAAGTRMRRKGRIVSRDCAEVGSCDFGEGEKPDRRRDVAPTDLDGRFFHFQSALLRPTFETGDIARVSWKKRAGCGRLATSGRRCAFFRPELRAISR